MKLKNLHEFSYKIFRRRAMFYELMIADQPLVEKIRKIFDWLNKINLSAKRKLGIYLPITFGVVENDLFDPVGISNLSQIEKLLEPFEFLPVNREPCINFFIPTIAPGLIFGGYIAAFNFVRSLVQQGYTVRLISCEALPMPIKYLLKDLKDGSAEKFCLEQCEVMDVMPGDKKPIEIGSEDICIGYSWVTMRKAADAAAVIGKTPVFFIQEYEAIFYAYDSIRFLCDSTYRLKHFAVFNSPQLENFFRTNRLGVFADEDRPDNYLHFRHAIAAVRQPTVAELSGRTTRKLLFYARPEKHAARNIFEIGFLALKQAVAKGVFDASWEFYGIGSIGERPALPLGDQGQTISLMPRVSFDEYKTMLSDYDLGLSLMYSPHPSVPPLEMARAGMATVTTCFRSRSKADMERISGNLIAAECTIESVVDALKTAVERIVEHQARVDNADFDWPTDWAEVFDAAFVADFFKMVRQ